MWAEAQSNFGGKGLLKKAMGWFLWDRTTPIPTLDASISMVKGRSKSGRARTRA